MIGAIDQSVKLNQFMIDCFIEMIDKEIDQRVYEMEMRRSDDFIRCLAHLRALFELERVNMKNPPCGGSAD